MWVVAVGMGWVWGWDGAKVMAMLKLGPGLWLGLSLGMWLRLGMGVNISIGYSANVVVQSNRARCVPLFGTIWEANPAMASAI